MCKCPTCQHEYEQKDKPQTAEPKQQTRCWTCGKAIVVKAEHCDDCRPAVPKPKEKALTAGENWVGTVGDCPLGYNRDGCEVRRKAGCFPCESRIAKAIDLYLASTQSTPEPPAETAFRKAARGWMRALCYCDRNANWGVIEEAYPNTIAALRVFREAVLDEAKRAIISPKSYWAMRNDIEALRAK